MESGNTVKIMARWVALGALFLVPLTPLIVADSYFFPFITGKAFFFRILVEIAVCAWLLLAALDREYRPRFSWIGGVVTLFVAWMFVADLFAINVLKAFWSNFERMEGWVLLVHLLGFFFTISCVLRVEKQWRAWFLTSLGVSVIISLHALLQLGGVAAIHQGATRIDASFGNSIYLAIYFLFNVFIAGWLALTEERGWLKWSLIGLACLEGVLIFFTGTRGAVLGLVGALFLATFLTVLTAGKRARQVAIAALVLLVVLVGGFYLAKDSSLVQDNYVLQRIASISLDDGKTRFTIWHMALKGVQERPVVGWGQEGFNYVFNKYYDPSLYGQESWFDRAHNAFIDWLSAGGVPALLLYIALFGTAIAFLWQRSELSRPERIALTAALVGCAIHNFFVFDNLFSYIYFFAILAMIDSQVARPTVFEHMPEVSPSDGLIYGLPAAVIFAGSLILTVNVPGIRVSAELIDTLSSSTGDVAHKTTAFEKLLARPTFAAQEIREQLVTFAGQVAKAPSVEDTQKQALISLAIREMQKQVGEYPDDARGRLQLAYAYRAGGAHKEVLAEVLAATRLSPNKQEMWLEAGSTQWELGDTRAAQTAFHKAYALGPQFNDLAAYAAAGDLIVGDKAAAQTLLLEVYGTTTVDSNILAAAYYRTKDWQPLLQIWKMRVAKPDATAQMWFSLAAVYYAAGDKHNAIATITAAVERFPEAAASGAAAIKQIQAGK